MSANPPGNRALRPFYTQKLDWRDCDRDFECATVEVPVDYQAPDGETLDIAVARRPATGGKRIGSLFVNPGGPGASGIDYAQRSPVSKQLGERYDLVGFDPRGVAESAPVECMNDKQTDEFLAADGSPDSAAEEREAVRLGKRLGQLCASNTGDHLAHVGTADAARDLDILRAALGDEQLHYLGKSYGTYLGAVYAELFPRRVGRLVLDGAMDPSLSLQGILRGQAIGFERALKSFAADCSRHRACPLPADPDRAVEAVAALVERADAQPLRGTDGRPVTQSLALLGVAAALYDAGTGWAALRQALAAAEVGDGRVLLLLADFYADRGPGGKYASNSNDANPAINCLDRPGEGGVPAIRRFAQGLAQESPVFGAFVGWSALVCLDWPVAAPSGPGTLRAAGAKPILVIGTTRDPATPYEWARALAGQLESGRLLTYEGDGHTAYRQGDNCVDDAVDGYLLPGSCPTRAPAAGEGRPWDAR